MAVFKTHPDAGRAAGRLADVVDPSKNGRIVRRRNVAADKRMASGAAALQFLLLLLAADTQKRCCLCGGTNHLSKDCKWQRS